MRAARLVTAPLCAAALALWATAGSLGAATIAEQAAEIDKRAEAGDYEGAMAVAGEMEAGLWQAVPGIGFSEVLTETERSAGYGLYNPRPDGPYKQGEPVLIYVEPYGFGYGSGGEGIFTIGFYVDLQVLAQDGSELANMTDITQLDHAARAQLREFGTDIIYNFNGLKPGKYRLITTLRDKNSAKTGSFETAIEVSDDTWTDPAAAPADAAAPPAAPAPADAGN